VWSLWWGLAKWSEAGDSAMIAYLSASQEAFLVRLLVRGMVG
jgi:hypothetical protein